MSPVPSRPLPPGIPADWDGARRLFEAASAGLKCSDLLHVRHDACSAAALDMFVGCMAGSLKFFFPFYLLHTVWNGKKAVALDKDFYKGLAIYYTRSVLFGATMGTSFTIVSCVLV